MSKNYNKIGIIGAMRVEIEALAAAMENPKTEVISTNNLDYADVLWQSGWPDTDFCSVAGKIRTPVVFRVYPKA